MQNDHNVAVHSDQTGCPPSAPKTLCYAGNDGHASEYYVLLYTQEDFSLKTRNVPSSGIRNPTKTRINQEKTPDEEKKKKKGTQSKPIRERTPQREAPPAKTALHGPPGKTNDFNYYY